MHDIYRDYLAVHLGGVPEPRVNDLLLDRSDVWVGGDPTKLIEVVVLQGSGATQLKAATGQLKMDELQMFSLLGERIKESILYVIKGGNLEDIDGQEKQIRAKEPSLRSMEVILKVVSARKDFPKFYEIGGVTFDRPKNVGIKYQIYEYLATIREDFSVVEHLSDAHHNFLLAMADAWARLTFDRRALRVDVSAVSVKGKQGMALEVSTGQGRYDVTAATLINAFFMMTHYQWVTRPVA